MSEALVVAVSSILVALLGGGGLAGWLNSRNARRLAAAQAGAAEMSTVELVDRIARDALKSLEERVERAEERAERAEARAAEAEARADSAHDEVLHERRVNRAAISYIERLLDYIAGHGSRQAPPMPVELVDYIGGGV